MTVGLAVRRAALRAGLVLALALVPQAASAIVQGTPSALEPHMVRIVGRGGHICSGVAIDRTAVLTAAHCGGGTVLAGGQYIAVAARTRALVLSDGTHVTVAGDSAILKLRAPLPGAVTPLPVGRGDEDGPFVIAGYGTANEASRAYGALREATLVDSKVERHMLVDPNRSGPISASACFGDSGGPVLRRSGMGYAVVGVITRANYPNRPIACGFYTRYAPVRASGTAVAARSAPAGTTVASTDATPYGGPPAAASAPSAAPRRVLHASPAQVAKRRAPTPSQAAAAPVFPLFALFAAQPAPESARRPRR